MIFLNFIGPTQSFMANNQSSGKSGQERLPQSQCTYLQMTDLEKFQFRDF